METRTRCSDPRIQETHQFDVSLRVQHEVLRLQVSVEDSFAVEVVESLCDATDTEFGDGLVKAPPAGETLKCQMQLLGDRREVIR